MYGLNNKFLTDKLALLLQDVVQSCLQSNICDVNVRDNAGYTPLHECVTRGHLEIARMLLMHGADPEASAAGGIKPIHDAVECDHIEVTRLLLSFGADPTISTYAGSTPLKLSHSKAMSLLLRGFLSDLNGDVVSDQRWKFSSFRSSPVVRNGFDIFASEAPEGQVSCHLETLIEESDQPLCPTFSVRLSDSSTKVKTVARLKDVLQHLNMSRADFESQMKEHQIISIQDFSSRSKCKQVNETRKESCFKEEVLLWNQRLRVKLGVRLTKVE